MRRAGRAVRQALRDPRTAVFAVIGAIAVVAGAAALVVSVAKPGHDSSADQSEGDCVSKLDRTPLPCSDAVAVPRDETAQTTAAPREQRCVDKWNNAKNPVERQQLAGLYQQTSGSLYVSVGFAADYPDKCLIAVAAPNINVAMQFLEGRPGHA